MNRARESLINLSSTLARRDVSFFASQFLNLQIGQCFKLDASGI